MKIKFDLTDEVTITNDTVKLTASITGIVGANDREALEAKCREITTSIFPEAKWSFSNFTYQKDAMTFAVNAVTRVNSTLNQDLDIKAETASKRGEIQITFHTPDVSIPLFQKRAAESELRITMLKKAQEEAEKLGGEVTSIVFGDPQSMSFSNSMMASATYAKAPTGGMAADALGHSEKIQLTTHIVVRSKEAARKILREDAAAA